MTVRKKKVDKNREKRYEKLDDRFMRRHYAFERCCINNVLTNNVLTFCDTKEGEKSFVFIRNGRFRVEFLLSE